MWTLFIFYCLLELKRTFNDIEEWPTEKRDGDLTMLFISTSKAIRSFLVNPTIYSMKKYGFIWGNCRITWIYKREIIDAYISKNEKNYERQRIGILT